MKRAGRVFFILAGLLALAVVPRLALGVYDRAAAERAWTQGNFPLAADSYSLAAQRLFWQPALWERAGEAAWRAGRRDAAKDALETARAKGALSDRGREILGEAYASTQDWHQALHVWEPLLKAGKGDAALYAQASRMYEALYPDDDETLRDLYRQWAEKDPQSAYPQYRLGMYLALENPDEAMKRWMTAARLDETYAPAVETLRTGMNLALIQPDEASRDVFIGRALALTGEWSFAEDAFAAATRANPQDGEAWAWLGEARQHLDEDVGDAPARALHLSPRSPVVRSLLGMYYQRREAYSLAEAQFQAAASLEPKNPAWQAALGEVIALEGDLPRALRFYQRAASLSPDSPTYWRLLAQFCVDYRIYLRETGLPAAQKASALSNQDALSLDTLGQVYFLLDERKEAEAAFSRALESNPNFSLAYLHLAKLYLAQGKMDAAKDALLHAAETARDPALAREAARLLRTYFP